MAEQVPLKLRRRIKEAVYFEPDVAVRIRALAASSKVSRAAFVRDAVERALPKWELEMASSQPLTFGAEADACAKCANPSALRVRPLRRRK